MFQLQRSRRARHFIPCYKRISDAIKFIKEAIKMRHFLLLTFFVLAGCGEVGDTDSKVTLGGSADVNLQDNFTECLVRQNGTSLVVQQTGRDPYIFIFDPAVIYPDSFETLTASDALRITPLTVDEQAIIAGTL
jgi:hypothetical protein